MNKFALIGFSLLFLISGYLSFDFYGAVQNRKILKEDYAEINKANYELFNIQLWKEDALAIVRKKINEFEFSPGVYEMLDREINRYLNTLYTQYIESGELLNTLLTQMEESGKINQMFKSIIQTNVAEQLDVFDVPAQIPGFTNQIVEEIKRNEPMLKAYLQQELLRMVLDDASDTFRDRRQRLVSKHGQNSIEDTEAFLKAGIDETDLQVQHKMWTLIGVLLAMISLILGLRKKVSFVYLISTLTLSSILILILGVTLPMIDIDARLNSFSFELLNEPISFDEQVIFYQSKSIVEVTKTLWDGGTIDLKIVGVLVLLFSIIFPFFKLILSGLYLFLEKVRNSRLAQTIIFHLGKWSMADVFVVAMFMAYFGFYGLISSQLGLISSNQGGFAIETINYSKLSPGALFFTAYTILSIFIGILINRNGHQLES